MAFLQSYETNLLNLLPFKFFKTNLEVILFGPNICLEDFENKTWEIIENFWRLLLIVLGGFYILWFSE